MPIHKNKPKPIFLFIAGLFFLVFCYLGWKQYNKNLSPRKNGESTPVQAVLQGEYSCLPNKATDGPVTLECALGLKANDGSYYALDMSGKDPTMSSVLQVGQKMEVSGLLLYIKDPNSLVLKKYDIKGVLKVENLKLSL
jgi:hypothetical protein